MEILKNHYGADCLAPYGSLPRAYNPKLAQKLADNKNFELFSTTTRGVLNSLETVIWTILGIQISSLSISDFTAWVYDWGDRVNFPWCQIQKSRALTAGAQICSALESFLWFKIYIIYSVAKKIV